MARAQLSNSITSEHKKTNQRLEGRQKLILRVGLLEQDGRSIFCLVKNISASGVQVKPYGNLISGTNVSLRVGDENPIPGAVMWCRDGLAGVKFQQTLNPQGLLRIGQKMLMHRRRNAPRLPTALKATLRTGGKKHPIIICDLSMTGARVRTEGSVTFGETTTLEISGLPSLTACVRWSDRGESGVSFHPPLPIQIVAELLSAVEPRVA